MRVVGPIAIAYLLTWGVAIGAMHIGWSHPSLALLIMWIPGFVALLSAWVLKVPLPLFRRPVGHYFTAPLWAIGIGFAAMLLSLPFGIFSGPLYFDMVMASLHLPLTGGAALFLGLIFFALLSYVVGITLNMVIALGEELLWRGLLWEQLKHLGLLPASLIIGFIWGVWHAPAIWVIGLNHPGVPLWIDLAMKVVVSMSLTPILCYFRARGDSIGVVAAFHGTLNGMAMLAFVLFEAPNTLTIGVGGLPGIALYMGLSALLIWRQKSHYRRDSNVRGRV